MKRTIRISQIFLSIGFVFVEGAASAQFLVPVEPHNIVQMSATGSVEAQQDWLSMTLYTSKDGSDANAVQAALRLALEAAMNELKKSALVGSLEVHSGSFSLLPRYTNDGRINGWSGSTELLLEGGDFSRISAAAAKVQSMTIRSISFGLSRPLRVQLEAQAQVLAIENFKLKAAQIAHSFGFSDYQLREVSVSTSDQSGPVPRLMAMSTRAIAADAPPIPLESGKSLVNANVSGAVQLK